VADARLAHARTLLRLQLQVRRNCMYPWELCHLVGHGLHDACGLLLGLWLHRMHVRRGRGAAEVLRDGGRELLDVAADGHLLRQACMCDAAQHRCTGNGTVVCA
jgi:hypothetical protein